MRFKLKIFQKLASLCTQTSQKYSKLPIPKEETEKTKVFKKGSSWPFGQTFLKFGQDFALMKKLDIQTFGPVWPPRQKVEPQIYSLLFRIPASCGKWPKQRINHQGILPHYVDQITVGQEVIHERAEICAERLEQRFKPKDMTTNVTPDIILAEEDGANLFSPKEIKNMISKELNPKNPVQIPEIETCFMFIDEIEGEIPCPRAHNIYRRRSSEFFWVPGIWRNMKKYEEIMKKYEGITFSIYRPWDL